MEKILVSGNSSLKQYIPLDAMYVCLLFVMAFRTFVFGRGTTKPFSIGRQNILLPETSMTEQKLGAKTILHVVFQDFC